MDALVEMPGTGLARPSPKGALAALINTTLTDVADMMVVADRCRGLWTNAPDHNSYLGDDARTYLGFVPEARFLDRAKSVLGYLWHLPAVDVAYGKLLDILDPSSDDEVTHAMATKMLSVLFGALAKKKADTADENPAMLMAACADIFHPMNDVIGETTGLWKPVCKHPIVLALAIKKLIATQKWSPTPSELREAMKEVQGHIQTRADWLCTFVDWMGKAEKIVFEFDRPAWEAACARHDSGVVLSLRDLRNDGPSEDTDENGNPEFPPSPRWQALDDLAKAKLAAEEAAESTPRIAACKTTVGKRTRKPKREKGSDD
jgi:hypothetical protein